MRPNFLHQFIHALDLGEQRICKEQIAKDNSKWAKQRNAFLAAMMKLQHYDAEALAASISDQAYLKALPNERHRMSL